VNTETYIGGGYRFGGFVVDPARRELRDHHGEVVRLPARAFQVLLELLRHAGQPVSKDALLEAAWKGRIVEENSLSRAISTLRNALGDDASSPRFIATIPGEGYQFVAPIEERAGAPGAGNTDAAPQVRQRHFLRRLATVLLVLVLVVAALAAALWWRSGVEAPATAGGGALVDLEILTDFPGSHSQPSLSPDGEWLAFTSDASGTRQIWTMSLDDRIPQQLTDGESPASRPAWSPDGSQIAFQLDDTGTIAAVHPLGEGRPRPLVEGGARNPSFSPDGDWLVYDWGRQIRRANADGSDPRSIEGVPERRFLREWPLPAVSPNGSEIAYFLADEAVLGDFWRIPATGGEPRRVTEDGSPGMGLAWFPDGDALAVSSMRGGRFNLWRVPLDGSEPTPLTSGVGDDRDPVVSPDGEWIIYAHQETRWQLVSSDPATGEESVVIERRTPIVIPDVAPDGHRAVYFSGTPANAELFTADLRTGETVQVTDDPDRFAAVPTWSGDGRRIYYQDSRSQAVRRIDQGGRNDVEAFPDFHFMRGHVWLSFQPGGDRFVFNGPGPDGGRRTVVRSLGGEPDRVFEKVLRTPDWSPDGTRLVGSTGGGASGPITVCDAESGDCAPLLVGGEPVEGVQPKWSRDGSRVFFRRRDDPTRLRLWVADPQSGAVEQVLDLGPVDPSDSVYSVAEGDHIVWARTLAGESKIWRGRRR
jgi:Tol biopolymer transport system component/DNA-binding winged helix-turn-helix (wHTH) protein